jgi:hypothetical protein
MPDPMPLAPALRPLPSAISAAAVGGWRFCPACGQRLLAAWFEREDEASMAFDAHEPRCSGCCRPWIACPCKPWQHEGSEARDAQQAHIMAVAAGEYVSVSPGGDSITLDGTFRAAQLRALADILERIAATVKEP